MRHVSDASHHGQDHMKCSMLWILHLSGIGIVHSFNGLISRTRWRTPLSCPLLTSHVAMFLPCPQGSWCSCWRGWLLNWPLATLSSQQIMMWCPWMFQSLLQTHLLHRVLDLDDDWSTKPRRVLLDLDQLEHKTEKSVAGPGPRLHGAQNWEECCWTRTTTSWSTKLRRVWWDSSVVRQQCGETVVSTMQLLVWAERKRVYVGLPRSQLL